MITDNVIIQLMLSNWPSPKGKVTLEQLPMTVQKIVTISQKISQQQKVESRCHEMIDLIFTLTLSSVEKLLNSKI